MSDPDADGAEAVEPGEAAGSGGVEPGGGAGLEAVLEHIKEQRSFDFTGYKRASLERRVLRRMEAVKVSAYDDYLDRLIVDPDEYSALLDTILINVTGFFRDPDSWDYLRTELLPTLLRARQGQQVRVWCAGCASGEEAYTIAMILAEALGLDDVRERVKIYATDVDEDALAQARTAAYTERDVEAVPPELRERYFERTGSRWVVRKELRRSVIFGRNDLVQDAPISHVDLLTCRNTVMYFTAETQARVMNRLHFALRPDGVLFLGKAEMLLSHSTRFRAIEVKRRFFRKLPEDPRDRRVPDPAVSATADDPATVRLQRAALTSTASPAQLTLDLEGRLVLATQRAMHLFGLGPRDVGRMIQDLELSYRPVELRGPIEEALGQRRPLWLRDVELLRGTDPPASLDVQLVPLFDETGAALGLSITFNDVTSHRELQRELEYANRQLETAYEELQSANEELETTNEELQSTVEELETTNEELQSTNEELETINAELQSMNDEFQTNNDTLRERQDEVDRLNIFLGSVLGSMNSGVVVVDADMTVLAWNSRAEDLWGVRRDEAVGQHLMNLDIGLPVEQLRAPVRARLGEEPSGPSVVVLDAVNRRGRSVRVQVTLTDLEGGGPGSAAMLVMDVLAG